MSLVLLALAASHPTAPVISASAASGNSISIALTTPSTEATFGIGSYNLLYSTTGSSGPFTTLASGVSPAAFPYLWAGLSPSTYYLIAQGVDRSPNLKVSPSSPVTSATLVSASGIRLNGGNYVWPADTVGDFPNSGNLSALLSFINGLPAYVRGIQLYFAWHDWDLTTVPPVNPAGVTLNTSLIDSIFNAAKTKGIQVMLAPNIQRFGGSPGSNTSPTSSQGLFPTYLDLPAWNDGSGFAGYQWGPPGPGLQVLQLAFYRTSTTPSGVSVQSAFFNFQKALQIYIASKSYAANFECIALGETSNGLVSQDYTDPLFYAGWAAWITQMRAQAAAIATAGGTQQIAVWCIANYMPTSSNYMAQLLAVAKAQSAGFGGPDNYKDGGIAANELFNGTLTGSSSVGTIPWFSKSEYPATAFTSSGPGQGNTATPAFIYSYNWNGMNPPHNGAHTEGNLMPHYYIWAQTSPGTAPAGRTYFQYADVLTFLSGGTAIVNPTKPSDYP